MNHLENAIRKCVHREGREWVGYLIPKEILALKDAGVDYHPSDIRTAIDWKKRGINNPSWFYFKTNKKTRFIFKKNLRRPCSSVE